MPRDAETERPSEPSFAARVLSLLGLSSLAIAQPVLGSFNPGFFIAHRAVPADLIVLALALLVVPFVLVLALEEVVRRLAPKTLPSFHALLIGFLGGCAVAQGFINQLGWIARAVIWLAVGLALAAAYTRSEAVRTFATFLGAAPVLVLVSFLVLGPNSALMFPKEPKEREPKAAAGASAEATAPVVIVIFDELPGTTIIGPDGRIPSDLFPNFAELAKAADWYPNASTVHNWTTRAVPAFLTGRVAGEQTLPHASDHPRSLFTLLGDRYEKRISEPYTQVCPRSMCRDIGEFSTLDRLGTFTKSAGRIAANRYLPSRIAIQVPAVQNWREIDVSEQIKRFEEVLHPRDVPSLYMLHTLVPHRTWRYLADGKRYVTDFDNGAGFAPDPLDDNNQVITDKVWPVTQQYQRHVIQTQYADTVLGRVVDRMKATGLWDESVLVVTSDHGQSLRPGNPLRRRVTRSNVADILTVPLFIKAPNQSRGSTSLRFARTVDVVPTVADLVGIRLPWKVDGVSLTSPGPDRRELTMHKFPTGRLTVPAEWFRSRARRDTQPRSALLQVERQGADAYAMGPNPELLGRRVPERLPLRPGTSAKLVTPNPLPAVGRRSDLIEARLAATTDGIGRDQALAVAVAGKIIATTRTYRSANQGTVFTAMLRPDDIARGGRIQILWVAGDDEGIERLARVPLHG